MKLHAYSTWTSFALACSAAVAMTGDHLAVAFRGDWVPAKAACTSPLKLVIDANVVTFVNGAQRAEFVKLFFLCRSSIARHDLPQRSSR